MPAVILTATVPPFASPEEHLTAVSSTPSSFGDIPPILRHKEDNVRVKLEPPIEGLTDSDVAQGTLYVIDSALVFMSLTGRGFQISYPSITLHAISRGGTDPSIYCQLDVGIKTMQNGQANENSGVAAPQQSDQLDETAEGVDETEEEDTELQELTIIPSNSQSLEKIFESLSFCASLHPDPANGDDDDDDEAFINGVEHPSPFETFTGDETQELSEVGRAALAHLESIIYDPHNHLEDNVDSSDENGEEYEDNGEDDVADLEREFEKVSIRHTADGTAKNINGKVDGA